ncbi:MULTISPECIES: ATP-grasp domain-containing protein [Bradyrhizobium]|uniref:ATP-grasp domain-containing protein n=1 Tax=Bradyrhizobium elkanii TaxID=29448 RepID=A0A4U6S1S4_BRAEL|nr:MULTISPECIES: ATP-grasp domain-containing protein [Bradyrhizobium]MTV15202.1 ATP-grasp domain-containing protein [Bradyrhizobium sp. BR2003]TKV81001.1 ATP-grasp domain-containing protein [Bradyrhizobium elkanii]
MKTRRAKVLLTGIGGGGHGEQILKALRLGEIEYDIVGTDTSDACANRNRVNKFVQLPRATDPKYLDELRSLAQSEKCLAIFHGSEPEMAVFSRSKPLLEADGLYVPVNPPAVLEICQDKFKTMAHLTSRGFRTPKFIEVRKLEDTEAWHQLPAILKPSVGGGGSANVFIVQSRNELLAFSQYLLGICECFILQEYVGSSDEEYTVGVLFGRDGSFINSIAIRRVINNALTIRTQVPNRTSRGELGSRLIVSTGISQGHVADWPQVREACEAIASSLGPTAPVNVQCRVVDGAVIPFEINPRFSGTTSLRAMVGYNEPDVLIRRDVFGESIAPRFPYREAMILRGLEEHAVA